ncbi:hypothetical protein NP493_6440g00000 [Ridgeia piscesae]|uniref:Uncharacterized protein n=1 Tax=Ridgeia piscesae TaxID=27915 RepID=A0AAD9IRV5_RIDPI|nr:hypothetical protein NP493_6440g00000 [Ridgeia piscesae]
MRTYIEGATAIIAKSVERDFREQRILEDTWRNTRVSTSSSVHTVAVNSAILVV